MCGIAGFVGAGDREILARMTSALTHRGPDDFGYWHENDVWLGHRRLSIIDLAGGHQPMSTPDRELTIIFNGEIYNHAELRRELKDRGHHFQTDHSDTEVLLLGYRQWGEDLPNHLNGMWALVIHDRKKRQLFCSRDRFGKKPFYYSAGSDYFIFSSELNSLTEHPRIARELNRRALQKYFAYGYIPGPLTIYQSVNKLPGGYSAVLHLDTFKFRLRRYWQLMLEPFDQIPRNPEEEWGGRIRELLDRAVQRRLVSDVPLGVFLSGGIDSSAVTALAARHLPEGELKTFSIGFEDKTFDESSYAQEVAAQCRTHHQLEVLSFAQAHDVINECLAHLDEPMGDSSILPTYLLSRFARRHVTVALGGDGGDELFAGYDPFQALGKAELYQALFPRPIHQGIRALFNRMPVSHANMSLDFKIKRTLRGLSYQPAMWLPVWMGALDPREIEELFGKQIDLEDLYSEAIELWDSCPQDDLVDRSLQFYTNLYLQDDILVKADRANMMNSLEVRAPFLDIEFVDFVRRIPANYKLRGGETKYILKKALEPLLPRDILYRRKKGFGVPIGAWFRDGALRFEGSAPPMLDWSFVQKKLASHVKGRSDERALLWNVYVLQKWANAQRPEQTSLAA